MSLEYMSVPIEWKADPEDKTGGTLLGYASTFGNVDRGGDEVQEGAFDKFVTWVNAAKENSIPLLADHVAMTSHVLGSITAAKADKVGLQIKAVLSKAPSVQDVVTKMKEGHVNVMSIGYEAMDYAFEDRNGQQVRLLKEVKLWETSTVVFAMNPLAAIQGVKNAMTAATLAGVDATEVEQVATGFATDLAEVKAATPGEPSMDTMTAWVHEYAVETKTGVPSSETAPAGPVVTPPAGEDSGSAAASDEESGEQAPEGEAGVKWDKYASEAILSGRPTGEVDAATRANLAETLRLNEAALTGADTD